MANNKIGIWLRYGYNPTKGGGFSYYDALMSKLDSFHFSNGLEWCFVSPSSCSEIDNTLCLGLIPDNWKIIKILTKNYKIAKGLQYISEILFRKKWQKKLNDAGISYIYYINQDDTILNGFPYVCTIWDMGYYMTYPFPELIQGRNFKGRKKHFDEIIPKALLVLSESEAGKRALIKYANVLEEKIKVIPIFAGNVINLSINEDIQHCILDKFGLSENKFFFYPAQFWAHKNHVAILEAFKRFKKEHPDFKVVFTGGDKGNAEYIKSICSEWELEANVLFLGYVSKETIYTFYKKCTCLIMASYFGPTNMPPIEAMHLGCPVICTDVDGHKEILNDSAIYFSAVSWQSLLEAMCKMLIERDTYISRIIEQSQNSKFNIDYALTQLDKYLNLALTIRKTWK
ncbi:glycosyltransferase family 4 protein [Bacteroides caecigallinarum]|uniref:glycosyltransferase family 4 protein n=1 Tax=Bacteroides caecigallinarum TaxID=1411144 RepID=UPI00195C5CBE|nr:glycosyltransferase family 1 protein [Bacteroides caecigallinarum]MBM6884031.1 glycosyltransferase family 4 protein [Bacteroides caecigallinarum]